MMGAMRTNLFATLNSLRCVRLWERADAGKDGRGMMETD